MELTISPKPKMKMKKLKKQKRSAIDELLGKSYSADSDRTIPCLDASCNYMFTRDYDLQQHLRGKHHNLTSSPVITEAANDFDPTFDFPEMDLARTDLGHVEAFAHVGDGDGGELDAMYEQAEFDWELQQRALEERASRIGAGDEEELLQGGEPWMREDIGLRALVGEVGVGGSVYPDLD